MAQVEFRDGKREVPDHVRDMMTGLDTHKFTYEEATRLAEKKIVRDKLNDIHQNIIMRHFRNQG